MIEARRDRGDRRILIADDSSTYRAIAGRVLEDAGYLVEEVADGAEAQLRLADETRRFDLLVLELNLPKVRGLDLLRRVRETPCLEATRVLIVSESLTRHLRGVLADLHVDASLTKNHALRELLYQVDSLLLPRDGEQRRSSRRLSNLPVNYWVGEQLYLQSCFDVSDDGMFVAVADEEPPPVGTELSLRFWLPSSDRLIVCEGEIVWRNTAAGDLQITHPPGMGIRFTRIDGEDLRLVRSYLEANG